MRKIDKKEPDFYKEIIRKYKPEKWNDIHNKADIRFYMLSDEQNFQCAYTELRIEPETSHIDHYIKQSFILNDFQLCNYFYLGKFIYIMQ